MGHVGVFVFTFRAQVTDFPKEFFSIQKIDTSLEDMVFFAHVVRRTVGLGFFHSFICPMFYRNQLFLVKKTWDFCCLTYISNKSSRKNNSTLKVFKFVLPNFRPNRGLQVAPRWSHLFGPAKSQPDFFCRGLTSYLEDHPRTRIRG